MTKYIVFSLELVIIKLNVCLDVSYFVFFRCILVTLTTKHTCLGYVDKLISVATCHELCSKHLNPSSVSIHQQSIFIFGLAKTPKGIYIHYTKL